MRCGTAYEDVSQGAILVEGASEEDYWADWD